MNVIHREHQNQMIEYGWNDWMKCFEMANLCVFSKLKTPRSIGIVLNQRAFELIIN